MSSLLLYRPTKEERMGAKCLPLAYMTRNGAPPIFGRHNDVHERFGLIDQTSKTYVVYQSAILVSKMWSGDGTLQGCPMYSIPSR